MKQRLVGAAVLVLAAVVFVPMLLDAGDEGPGPREYGVVTPPPEPQAHGEPQDASAQAFPLGAAARAPAEPRDAPARADPASTRSGSGEPASKEPSGRAGFAVQLGSFSKAGNARGLRDRLVAKGYSAYVVTTDSITRVYVGPQTSRAEAERMREKLLAETKLEGIVVEHAG